MVEVVDASVMVAVLYPQDPFHEVSRDWFNHHLQAGHHLAGPLLLMSEVGGVIRRETGDAVLARQAVHWLYALPELQRYPLDEALARLAADLAVDLAVDLALRGADAVYVALAAQLQLPLRTWDRQQRERGGQVVDAREPSLPEG